MRTRDLLGPWGEAQAAEYLRNRGYTILACNYRCRLGEIDIIAQKGRYVVFVEVKLRKSDAFGAAREFVDRRKQDRIRSTAVLWLESHSDCLQPRFDVIEIYAPAGTETIRPQIIHLENAFA